MGKATRKARDNVQAKAAKDRPVPSLWTKWGPWFLGISGWVASVFLGLLDLPEKIVSFASNAPQAREVTANAVWDYKRFQGRFSSDPEAWIEKNLVGDGANPSDVGDVQLDIEYMGDGRYRGEIHSLYMAKQTMAQWSRVMLDGKMNVLGSVEFVMWDFVGGGRASLATFSLAIEDPLKGTLRLKPDAGRAFSGEVVLWPTTFEMADGVRGEKFSKLLREVVERNRDPADSKRQVIRPSSESNSGEDSGNR